MVHKLKNDDEKMITQIIYNILPPAYPTTVELIKRDLNRQVSLILFQTREDICQIYGQLQQNLHFACQHHSKSRFLFTKTIPYLQHFIRKLNLFTVSVVKWVIKQLTVGITSAIKTNLDHLVFKNETMLHVPFEQTSAPIRPKLQQPTLQQLHLNQHAPIATALIIPKQTALRNRLINVISRVITQMRLLM
jgi:hypothetical protein